jgi:hypothetical protein
MKKLLPLLMLAIFAYCSPSRITPCPQYVGVAINADSLPASNRDTIPEWMHISITRAKGFVMARKALSVQVNGICVQHLDCEHKPFPMHYKVGWCEGKDKLFNELVKERRGR